MQALQALEQRHGTASRTLLVSSIARGLMHAMAASGAGELLRSRPPVIAADCC